MKENLQEIIEKDHSLLFQNYGNRLSAAFVRGDGALLYDTEGNEYIDFLAGISVNNIGYNHPEFNKAVCDQISSLIHTSNWFFNREQCNAAAVIADASFRGKTLFSNSGTEANEAAIKLARYYGTSKSPDCYEIVSFTRSFHGRTFGGMSATAQQKIKKGFGPLVPGFIHAEFNDYNDFQSKVSENTCAVIIELVQGEGGIIVAEREFVKKVSEYCRENKVLLIIDEIQTGMYRTGKFFAYQHYDIVPDIITLAKAVANGIPAGAIHAGEDLVDMLPAGYHGSTFGGNHLAARAVTEVFRIMNNSSFTQNINEVSEYMFKRLENMRKSFAVIKEVRGLGLHIGIEIECDGMPLVRKALEEGLVINCTAGNVIRMMPPLIISMDTAAKGLDIFEKILLSGI